MIISCLVFVPGSSEGLGCIVEGYGMHKEKLGLSDVYQMGGYLNLGRGGSVGRCIGFCYNSDSFLLERSYFVQGGLGCTANDCGAIKFKAGATIFT
jgi:hypothetical protein